MFGYLVVLATVYLAKAGVGQEREPQAVIDAAREEVGAPGGILGVRFADRRVIVVASGVADRETGRTIRVDDAFFLGSISKTYTAVVVLRLMEEGRLSIEETVTRFLPSFPRGSEITVRHLLEHTSGLKDFYSYLYFRPDRDEMIEFVTKEWTEEELIALSGRFGHRFDPGTDWSYSSTNYFLLGVIIERVTARSLAESYRSYIYAPLAIEQTWLTSHEEGPSSMTITGYLGPVEGWKHSEMFGNLGATTVLDHSPVEWGAGGLAAPSRDALRFLQGLMAGELLSASSLEAMTQFRPTPPLGVVDADAPADDRPDGYGLGLIRMERAGFTMLGHGGLFTGHTAGLWYVPECELTISVFLNRGFVGHRSVIAEVIGIVTTSDSGADQCSGSGSAGAS